MAGYSRDRFPHWASQGNSCDTREIVLQKQGADVQAGQGLQGDLSGTWNSAYDGVVIKDAGEVDIDHTVPLAEAWRSGADKWTDDERKAFANDLGGVQLLAVTAKSNRSKGDQDPAKWKPPVAAYWCTYAQALDLGEDRLQADRRPGRARRAGVHAQDLLVTVTVIGST